MMLLVLLAFCLSWQCITSFFISGMNGITSFDGFSIF